MGLTSWAGERPRKSDTTVAKNYLTEDEVTALNLIVSAYLDFAELQAVSHKPMYMADWIAKLDDFIRITDREILNHAGTISHETARLKAEAEYDAFRAAQAALQQPVDRHFAESLDELKKIEGSAKGRKKPGRKKKDGGD